MLSWQIAAMSAAGAVGAGSLLFPWHEISSPDDVAAALIVRWPPLTVVAVTTYACLAAVLAGLAAFGTGAGSYRFARSSWSGRYFGHLFVTQYFLSVLILLVLGIARVPVDVAWWPVLPELAATSPALCGGAAVLLVGFLGWLLSAVAVALRADAARRPPEGTVELQQLREAIQHLQAATATARTPDTAGVREAIEHGQRLVLEAVKDLATAVNRVSQSLRQQLDETRALREMLSSRQPNEQAGSAAIEHATTRLEGAAAAVTEAVARLEETVPFARERASNALEYPPAGSRTRLSAELQALVTQLPALTARSSRSG
jgi:hypothetical protein